MRQSATKISADEALPNPDARSYTAAHDGRSEDVSTSAPARAGSLTRVEKILLAMVVAILGSGALVFSQLIEMQREIGSLRSDMTREIGDLRLEMREEIGSLRSEMTNEIGDLRLEMREEIGSLRSEVREEIAGLSERVARIETVLADRLPPRSAESSPEEP